MKGLRDSFEVLLLVLFLVDVAFSTPNSLSWYAMPSSLISSSVIRAGALMKAKPLNFPVLLFIAKSILHASRKQDVEFKFLEFKFLDYSIFCTKVFL